MSSFNSPQERNRDTTRHTTSLDQSPADVTPPAGTTPFQIKAQEAAEGLRSAAWQLLLWIIENDPRALAAVTSLDDDRLAQHLLEYLALGTWAGKPFVVPGPLRTAHSRTRLRTLFLPDAGMDSLRAERVLLSAMHDERPAVRETAVHILGLIGSPVATAALVAALSDPILTVRLQAAKALGQPGNAAAVPALLKALDAADELMGNQIFASLIFIGNAAVPALLAESNSHSVWVRWHCIRALGAIGDHHALPILVQALRDTDHSVAWVGAKSVAQFGKLGMEPVLRLLITADPSSWFVETASYVLRQLYQHDQKLKPYLEPVLESMHGVAYQIATPNAARKALSQLIMDGLMVDHSSLPS